MISLPVSIPLAALHPPVDPEEQGEGQRQDVPDSEEPGDNQPGGKWFFGCNFVNSLSIFFKLHKSCIHMSYSVCQKMNLIYKMVPN